MADSLEYYPPICTIIRNKPNQTRTQWLALYRDCCRHYSYKVRVYYGWMFFEFEDDYRTWKQQK